MLVTVLGITEALHPAIKVLAGVVTFPIVISVLVIMALQLSRESYFSFPFSTTMVVRLLHPHNKNVPIFVTLLGMVIEVRPVQ